MAWRAALRAFRRDLEPPKHAGDVHAPRPNAAPGARRPHPLLFEEDAPVLACRIEGRPGMCMLDTGNAGTTIVEGHWLERAGLAARLQQGLDVGDGVRAARAEIDFKPISLHRELVEFWPPAERGSEATQVVAAILSQDIIDRYVATIDYGDAALWLEPLGIAPTPYDRTGLGAAKQRDGSFLVTSVLAGSPAAQARFRPGDRITAIDGVATTSLSGADFFVRKRRPVGTLLRFKVLRGAHALVLGVRLRDLV